MYRLMRSLKRHIVSQRLKKIDDNIIPIAPDEIRLFMVVRNESLRLPFIFKYYFSLGVDRIFVIDHGSTDGTRSFLSSQKNTHIFSIKGRYSEQPYWMDLLLCTYGIGHWCVIVDADELLVYPHHERLSIPQLCAFLDREKNNALDALLLDMYPDKELKSIVYRQGADPLSAAPYFDPPPYDTKVGRFYGGLRKRVFGVNACISKFPLVKFNKAMFLTAGAHFIRGAQVSKDISGALLHFKFLNDFQDRVAEEVGRREHWRGAIEYRAYSKVLKRDPELNLYHPGSIRYSNSDQLVALGIMKGSQDFEDYVRTTAEK